MQSLCPSRNIFLAIIALALSFFMRSMSAHAAVGGSRMNAEEQRAAAELFQAANQDRGPRHLQPLHLDAELTEAAWRHAQRMVREGRLSHQFPGEPPLIVRVQQSGVHCTTVAENLADYPTASQINNEWMHSPPHRANLLDPRLNAVGIAVVKSNGELYAVQDFARLLTPMTSAQQEQQVASLLTARGLQVQGNSALARSYCGNSSEEKLPLPKLVMQYSSTDLSRLPPQAEKKIAGHKYHRAIVGACHDSHPGGFTTYQTVILLY